jgi:hypothetical protein
MPISPSESRDLADENNNILTEWKWFETTVFLVNEMVDTNSERIVVTRHVSRLEMTKNILYLYVRM